MNNKIKITAVILYLFYITVNISCIEKNYVSLIKFIENNKFKYEYAADIDLIKIINNGKNVSITVNSPYIMLDNAKLYIYDLVFNKNNVIFIPYSISLIIKEYLFNTDPVFNPANSLKKYKIKYYLDSPKTDQAKNDQIKTKESDNKKNDSNNENENKNQYILENKVPDSVKIKAVIIDPGHGGSDPGAVGYSGIKEKDIALKAGLLLYDKLKKAYPEKKIILTRESDVTLSLEKRAQIANYVFEKYGPSLFISVHVNASRSGKSYGFETWYLVEEYRRKIIKEGEISSDADVEKVLNSMLNDEIYKESKFLAAKIQHHLNNEIGDVSADRGIKEQTYFVIKKSIMPAVLVEIGFNTNKYEEIRLTKTEYLNKITNAILYGINDFIKIYEQTNGYTK